MRIAQGDVQIAKGEIGAITKPFPFSEQRGNNIGCKGVLPTPPFGLIKMASPTEKVPRFADIVYHTILSPKVKKNMAVT